MSNKLSSILKDNHVLLTGGTGGLGAWCYANCSYSETCFGNNSLY